MGSRPFRKDRGRFEFEVLGTIPIEAIPQDAPGPLESQGRSDRRSRVSVSPG
jgi:hypothetical protein